MPSQLHIKSCMAGHRCSASKCKLLRSSECCGSQQEETSFLQACSLHFTTGDLILRAQNCSCFPDLLCDCWWSLTNPSTASWFETALFWVKCQQFDGALQASATFWKDSLLLPPVPGSRRDTRWKCVLQIVTLHVCMYLDLLCLQVSTAISAPLQLM